MATNNFDQDDQQDILAIDVNSNFSNISSTKKMSSRAFQLQIIRFSALSLPILTILAVMVWSGSHLFANGSQAPLVGSIPQARNIVANYCNALVKHDFSQAQQYILPNSTSPSDLLQQEVQDAENQNQGPLAMCTIFEGQDTTYPGGKQFDLDNATKSYTAKEVVSFQMEFFFQKPNAPTTYLTGSCQVLSTGNQQWLIYSSCPMDECPIPGWKAGWGLGPECPQPYVVGRN